MLMERKEEKREKQSSPPRGDGVLRKTLGRSRAFLPDVPSSRVKNGLRCGKS